MTTSALHNCTPLNERTPLTSRPPHFRPLSRRLQEHLGRIGWLGSTAIAVNSLTGPAMLNLPETFQKCGWLPVIACICFVCLFFCNTISKLPDNHDFSQEIEFSDAFAAFAGHRAYLFSHLVFFCCISCLNISSIVDTAQVIDTILGHWTGTVAGRLEWSLSSLSFELVRWSYEICSTEDLIGGTCTPFGGITGSGGNTKSLIFTLGTFLTAAAFLPLALVDLTENAVWQILAFGVLIVTSLQFMIQFWWEGLDADLVPVWGEKLDDMFGVILFNFCLVLVLPAWLYERESHVSVPVIVYGSSVLSAVLYVGTGVLGAMTMPNVSQNMLESLMSGTLGTSIQIAASVFAFFIVGFGIPLFSVLTRLNLTGSQLCTRSMANLLAVYAPFALSFLLYEGESVKTLLSWGGTVCTSLAAFIMPVSLSLYVVSQYDYAGRIRFLCGRPENLRLEKHILLVLLVLSVFAVVLAFVGIIA